jgi:ABC-type glycerol-3-phosphate transport system substrate-binding protein
MIPTQHAIESHTMVAGAKSDAGVSYRNCPLETNPEKLSKSKVEIAFGFDDKDYTKQQCLIAPLKQAPQPEAAAKFVEFFIGTEGVKLLSENGMTGCLTGIGSSVATTPKVGPAPTGKEIVEVRAFYPGNEGHARIRKMVLDLSSKYPGKVRSEFTDFTSDEGFKQWQAAGLTCGAILINNEQTWTYEKKGKPEEITFKMGEGGEWTQADLYAVIEKIIKDKSQ